MLSGTVRFKNSNEGTDAFDIRSGIVLIDVTRDICGTEIIGVARRYTDIAFFEGRRTVFKVSISRSRRLTSIGVAPSVCVIGWGDVSVWSAIGFCRGH